MKPIIARLDGTTAPALLRLMPCVWAYDWDADFLYKIFRWRYLDRPSGGDTWLVLDQSACVAVLDSYLRPYLLDGRRILVRETADWFCLPEYRPLGLGLRLMRRMMAAPEPILVIGGTAATRSLLARLGWQRLAEAQRMILPVTLRSLAGNVLRHGNVHRAKYARTIPGFVRVRWPRPAPPPVADAHSEEWHPGRKLGIPVPRRNGLIELLDMSNLEWLHAAPPDFIRPIALTFLVGSEPVGFSLSQLEPSASGPDGKIVHVQMATLAQPIVDWVIAETARRLAQTGAGLIRCRASTPEIAVALRRTGFMAIRAQPAHWWATDGTPPPSAIEAGYLCADDALSFEAAATLRARTAPAVRSSAS